MSVPKPTRPKDYLNGSFRGNRKAGGKQWHQEYVEQLLKHPGKTKAVYETIGRCFVRYMQYDADLRGLDGDEVYPE